MKIYYHIFRENQGLWVPQDHQDSRDLPELWVLRERKDTREKQVFVCCHNMIIYNNSRVVNGINT
jgi:hypothetical protein